MVRARLNRLVAAESADGAEAESGSVSLVDGRGSGGDGLHLLQRRRLEGRLHDGRRGVRLVGQGRRGRVKLTSNSHTQTGRWEERMRNEDDSDRRCTRP